MSPQAIQSQLEALQRATDRACESKETAIAFLKSAGLLNKTQQMPKKFNVHDHISPFQPSENCVRCGKEGTNKHEDGNLCLQCAHDDVFEVMNDKRD